MSSAASPSVSFSSITHLHGQLGVELAFVAPGEDAGLLPINSILMDLEDLLDEAWPPEVKGAMASARGWLDLIFDSNGQFSSEIIANFNSWHSWMEAALVAWENGDALPACSFDAKPTTTHAEEEMPLSTAPPTATTTPPGAATPDLEEKAIVLNLKDDAELLHEFHGESVELLQEIEQGLLVLESNPRDSTTINSIFRAFHTFKGGAGFLRLPALQDLAHDLESLLDAARQTKLLVTTEVIDLILAGADALKQYTNEIGAQLKGIHAGEPIVVPTSQLILRVQAVLKGEPAPAPAPPAAVQVAPAPAPAPVQAQTVLPAPVPATMESAVPAPVPVPVPPTMECAVPAPEPPSEQSPGQAITGQAASQKRAVAAESGSAFVKLDTWKLDALIDLVGELVIAQSMVVQDPDVQGLESRNLARSLRQLGRTTSELQRNAMSLRMVPVRSAFQKMTRLVRDIAIQQKKEVQLILEGEETELDRNIVEKLGDPLVHMIRNAVDHGIESPADRLAAGKPALGTVKLSASHQRGGILIRIQDDGKGLDAGRILAKAIERGLVEPNADLAESDIYNLIFMPGFSTAESITDLSGRGVGMDVVKRNIESLRGKVEIQSALGQGSTFHILLPLTLAIIDGLMVGVGADRYIIPTISVRESFRPRAGMINSVQERGELVMVRGRQTPVLRLGQFLGTETRAVVPEDGIIVVVESGDAMRAILVDELIGKQEVVIKSLGDTFQGQNLLAGAAVLGDGSVGLILDVDTIVKL
jgi:two-component system chemotaxis sensor kinase CheA